ncbi:MAG: hypothetical protein RBT76_13625 [candidate division Zixibacteria bacterium]|jgi:hypothetical protein|nr:hypothetical protein [candidate division Zixibacteria bacterium]
MKKVMIPTAFVILVVLNVMLLIQNFQLKEVIQKQDEQPSFLVDYGGVYEDLRGIYTYPGIGRMIVADGAPIEEVPSLTLAVFLSSETTCPVSMSEAHVFRNLLPVFKEREQSIVAICTLRDSSAIAQQLDDWELEIPLVIGADDTSMTFAQMGISSRFMPFKILYDSTMTAVYIRGADNTPESQEDFERAALWLSEMLAKRS